jgi:hypothetical protein
MEIWKQESLPQISRKISEQTRFDLAGSRLSYLCKGKIERGFTRKVSKKDDMTTRRQQ